MQSQTLKRYLVYSLLFASFALSGASVNSQERQAAPIKEELPIIKGDCPGPIALTLTATTPNVLNTDFSAAQLAAPRVWLNNSSVDKHFLYTFVWKREGRCCQITKALLTVKMRANIGAQSLGSSDAGNDNIVMMHAGVPVPPFNERVYNTVSFPFNAGQTATKSWVLNPAALNILNLFGTASVDVQDDTRVDSATLQLWGCCLAAKE